MAKNQNALDYDPFMRWGIWVEAILAGGVTSPIHTQRDFYAMLRGMPTLVRTDARVKAYAQMDLNRLEFVGLQKFIEREAGIMGVRACAGVFAMPPNSSWDELGNREWKFGKTRLVDRLVIRRLAQRYHPPKGIFNKNVEKE